MLKMKLPTAEPYELFNSDVFHIPDDATDCILSVFVENGVEPICDVLFPLINARNFVLTTSMCAYNFPIGSCDVSHGACFDFEDEEIQNIRFTFKKSNGDDIGYADFGVGERHKLSILGPVWVRCRRGEDLEFYCKEITHAIIDL